MIGAESPPDPLAFLITMAMVALFFYGVRESGKKMLARGPESGAFNAF